LSKIIGPAHGAQPGESSGFNMVCIEGEAEKLVASARKHATEILDQARTEAERIRAAARTQGYEEGRRQGQDEGRREGRIEGAQSAHADFEKETAGTTQALRALLSDLEEHRLDLLRQVEHHLVRLALTLAEKVVKVRLTSESNSVAKANLSEALEYVMSRQAVVVRLHPANLEATRAYLPDMAALADGSLSVNFVADEAIEPGGVLVTSGSGEVDAQISTQLERLAEQLLEGQPDEA